MTNFGILTLIRNPFLVLGQALKVVTGGGRWSLDPLQADLVDAVLSYLSPEIALCVQEQIAHHFFVSWMTSGRINVLYFYDESRLPLIADPQFADKLFKIDLFVEGKKQTAHVTFYAGRLFSVELKKPRKFFKGKMYRIGAVTEGRQRDSFTGIIDRAAHGKETETNP
jgi:hypothetical protein